MMHYSKHSPDDSHHRHEGGKEPSSFWMQDPKLVFHNIKLKAGDTFLDLGCGTGSYSFYASDIVDKKGIVFALDRSRVLVEAIKAKSMLTESNNLMPIVTDITKRFPIEDDFTDVCLLATVLHGIRSDDDRNIIFGEVQRVLKSDGQLAIIECKTEETPFGPPSQLRLSPGQLEKTAAQHGFKRQRLIDLGNNYLLLLSQAAGGPAWH